MLLTVPSPKAILGSSRKQKKRLYKGMNTTQLDDFDDLTLDYVHTTLSRLVIQLTEDQARLTMAAKPTPSDVSWCFDQATDIDRPLVDSVAESIRGLFETLEGIEKQCGTDSVFSGAHAIIHMLASGLYAQACWLQDVDDKNARASEEAHLMVCDEASGISQEVYDAINSLSAEKIVVIGAKLTPSDVLWCENATDKNARASKEVCETVTVESARKTLS